MSKIAKFFKINYFPAEKKRKERVKNMFRRYCVNVTRESCEEVEVVSSTNQLVVN